MKYLKVGLARTQTSELFLEVPDDFDIESPSTWRQHILEDLVEAQLHNDFDWANDFEYDVRLVKETDEETATEYVFNTIDNQGMIENNPDHPYGNSIY